MQFFIVIAPILLVAVVIWWTSRQSGRRGKPQRIKKDHRARQEHAVWAWTKVVTSKAGAVSTMGFARVEMQLEVHLPGSEPYTATTTWLVDKEALGYVEVGREVPVKIDPEDPMYIYPNGPWAKYAE